MQEPGRQIQRQHEARGMRASLRRKEVECKSWKDGSVEAGKSERSEDITAIEKWVHVCVCVFALLQWPHLPLHPVKEAQSSGGGVGSPPSATTTHTYSRSPSLSGSYTHSAP